MAIELKVPALGESVTEAIISQWLKQVGEAVQLDEPIVELETDKINVEINAPSAGVLTEINVHMFAHTARYKTKALKRELEEKSHLVHDKAITTLRSLSHADLADPDLTKVRTKMLDGVNEILEEPVLSDVGLYDFHIARQ